MRKEAIQKFWKMNCMILLSILVGVLSMVAVYLLPTEPMFQNVKMDTEKIRLERPSYNYLSWAGASGKYPHTILNSWSTHIMLMHAIYPTSGTVWNDAMLNHRYLYHGEDYSPTDVLLRNLEGDRTHTGLIHKQLWEKDGVYDKESDTIIYPRYWHGYLTVLKPMLLFTGLAGIREVNQYLLFALMVISIVLIHKKLGGWYAMAFSIILLTINPISAVMVLQFDAVIYIMLASVVLILWKNEWIQQNGLYLYFFLMIGVLTAFFDFLTFPLVGLCVPYMLYFLLNEENIPKKNYILDFFQKTFAWGYGYAGMWGGKWILCYLLTGYNTMGDALENAMHRTSYEGLTFFDAISMNGGVFSSDPIYYAFLGLVLYFIFIRKEKADKNIMRLFLIIGIMPFIWYIVFANHSFVSAGGTYRNLVITEFAFLSLFCESIRQKQKNRLSEFSN